MHVLHHFDLRVAELQQLVMTPFAELRERRFQPRQILGGDIPSGARLVAHASAAFSIVPFTVVDAPTAGASSSPGHRSFAGITGGQRSLSTPSPTVTTSRSC